MVVSIRYLPLEKTNPKAEFDGCRKRSVKDWAFLVTAFVSATIDRREIGENMIEGEQDLFLLRSGREGMVVVMQPDGPYVVIAGSIRTAIDRGALISEGAKRLKEFRKGGMP